MAIPKLHAPDFVSEERPQNGYPTLSLSRQGRSLLDACRESRLDRAPSMYDDADDDQNSHPLVVHPRYLQHFKVSQPPKSRLKVGFRLNFRLATGIAPLAT